MDNLMKSSVLLGQEKVFHYSLYLFICLKFFLFKKKCN